MSNPAADGGYPCDRPGPAGCRAHHGRIRTNLTRVDSQRSAHLARLDTASASLRFPVSGRSPLMEWRRFQGQQHLVELDGQFLSYIDQGEGNPVVLLHGLPTWGFVWDQVIPHLTASRRVLVPDLPGFGYSAKGDSFDRSIAAQTGVV